MKLSDLIHPQAITADLKAQERDAVIGELLDALVAAGAVEADLRDELYNDIIAREKNGSTGFGKGVAIPHVKHTQIGKIAAAVGVSQSGVDFNALDKAPVYAVFLLLSPAGAPDEHLQGMETIFSNLQKENFRKFLHLATTPKEITDLLHEADTQQLPS